MFLLICYGLGFDITRGHRYSFVFFPSILILVGAGLAPFWPLDGRDGGRYLAPKFAQVKIPFIGRAISGKAFVATVIGVAFLGTLTITNNLSHLKFYKADRFINLVQAESEYPAVIGTKTTIADQPIVVGIEILSTAWEVRRQLNEPDAAQRWPTAPRFIIAENNEAKGFDSDTQLAQNLATTARPVDLWLLGTSPELEDVGCSSVGSGNKGSYSYAHYVCE